MIEKLAQTGSRLVQLRQKLAAREGKQEYEKNCEAIRAEIARLEAKTAQPAISEESTASSGNRECAAVASKTAKAKPG